MAKKKKSEEGDGTEEDAPKSKKKLIIMVAVFVLIGGLVAKTVLLKPKPPTSAQVKFAKELAEAELANLCASHNGLPTHPLPTPEGEEGAKKGEKEKGGKGDKESTTTTTIATEAPVGPVDSLDAITINLAAGHYLKVGLALQIPVGIEPDKVKTEENWEAVALKIAIDRLSGQTLETLTDKRQAEEHIIGDAVCRNTEGKVLTVYFTDFVMQ